MASSVVVIGVERTHIHVARTALYRGYKNMPASLLPVNSCRATSSYSYSKSNVTI